MTRQSAWQGGDENQGQKVETQYIYTKIDGTIDYADSNNNIFLSQERVLLSQSPTEVWAETNYTYYSSGLVQQVIDPNDNKTYYEYDNYGFLKYVKAGKRNTSYGELEITQRYLHDDLGQQILSADQLNKVTLNCYDGFGLLYKVMTFEDPEALALPDSATDPNDAFTAARYEFYDRNDVQLLTTTSYGYDDHGNRTFEQVPAGGMIQTEYTRHNQPKTITYDDDNDTLFEYPSYGHDDDSRIEYLYGFNGQKIREYYHDAQAASSRKDYEVHYAYDGMDRPIMQMWFDYDNVLLKARLNEYWGSGKKRYERLYGYDYLNVLCKQRETTFEYDFLDRLTRKIVAPGEAGSEYDTNFAYDAVGNRLSVTDPNDCVTFFDYDNANRKIAEFFTAAPGTTRSSLDADDVREATEYYPNNSIKKVTRYDYPADSHALLEQTEFTYDHLNRLASVTESIDAGTNAVTYYDYDYINGFDPGSNGLTYQIRITDAAGKYTYRAFNAGNQLIRQRFPSDQIQEFGYNGDGTLASKLVYNTLGQERYVTYGYDAYGRLATTTYPDGGGYIDWIRDGFGRKIAVEDHRSSADNIGGSGGYAGAMAWDYDPVGRVTCVTDQDGYQVRYRYESDGQPQEIKVTPPGQSWLPIYQVEYFYYKNGRLHFVYEPLIGASAGYPLFFRYDANGNRARAMYMLNGQQAASDAQNLPIPAGDCLWLDYAYNRQNHLSGYTSSYYLTTPNANDPQFDLSAVTVDGLGRLSSANEILTKTDGTKITHQLTYQYDRMSRLTYAKINNIPPMSYLEYAHEYDNTGNITGWTKDTGSGDVTVTFNFDGDQATGDDSGRAVNWDENGRQTSRISTTPLNYPLQYNWDEQLIRGENDTPNRRMEAKYSPDGIRVSKIRIWDDSSGYHHKYIIDYATNVPAVLMVLDANNSNAPLQSYIYANEQLWVQHSGSATAPRYFYLHDQLGSVRGLINSSGAIVNCYAYDPWGLPIGNETAETVGNLFRFAGYAWDSEIEQYHCYKRQYDPYLFHFASDDPVFGSFSQPMTLRPYLYCLSDPVNRTDPSGEFAIGDVFSAIGTGMRLYNAADTAMSIYGYAQQFAEGMSFRSVMINASFDIACNLAAGKALDFAVSAAAPVLQKVGRAILNKHHVLPKFLGGADKGILAGLSPEMHTDYHKILMQKLQQRFGKKFGGWRTEVEWKEFLSDSNNRLQVGEVLFESAGEMDQKLGGDVLTSGLFQQIKDQNYFGLGD